MDHTEPISEEEFRQLITKFTDDTASDEEALRLLQTMNGVISELTETLSVVPTDDELRAKGMIE